MPIIKLGALLSLELALLKARKKKQSLIPPIAPISNHGLENTIGSFLYRKPAKGTWFYLILVEVGERNTSGFSLTIMMRFVPTSYEPSRATLAISTPLMGTQSQERFVQYLSLELS